MLTKEQYEGLKVGDPIMLTDRNEKGVVTKEIWYVMEVGGITGDFVCHKLKNDFIVFAFHKTDSRVDWISEEDAEKHLARRRKWAIKFCGAYALALDELVKTGRIRPFDIGKFVGSFAEQALLNRYTFNKPGVREACKLLKIKYSEAAIEAYFAQETEPEGE